MPLATQVKVGNITNLSEARYCAGMFVDYLGFPCDGTALTVEGLNEIAGWVTGPTFVLEASPTDTTDQIIQLVEQTQLKTIEVTFKQFRDLRSHQADLKFIIIINTAQWPAVSTALSEFSESILAFHIVSDSGWEQINEIAHTKPVLVDYAIFSDLQRQIEPGLIGIALAGSEEIRPGLKNYDHLADVLESLEVD